MKCHLSKKGDVWDYSEANRFDYPSIGQIIDIVNQKEILIIFAVTEDQKTTYKENGTNWKFEVSDLHFITIITGIGKATSPCNCWRALPRLDQY